MILDRYLSRPLQLVFGVWMVFFVMMRVKYIIQGYNVSSEKFPARWKGHQQCMNDPGHRIAFPNDCSDLDSISYFSPYWDGLDNAWRNTYFCGVVECSTIFDHAFQSLASLGIYFAAASILTVICGAFLYVILSRTLQLGYVEKRPANIEPAEYGQIPAHAWRQFNQFLHHNSLLAAGSQPALPANGNGKRLMYRRNDEEEEDH